MQSEEQIQSVVFFLTDHLCSAIEEGEQILNLSYTSEPLSEDLSSDDILDRLDDFHQFLDQIRTLEFLLVTKLNQARHWCIHLRYLDNEFKAMLDLFNSATSALVDIERVLGIDEHGMFNGEDSHEHFIKCRKLIIEQSDNEGYPSDIQIDDNYLLGGKIPLTDVLDACNTFLDSIDIRYDVMEDATESKKEQKDNAIQPTDQNDVELPQEQFKTA
ncbi:MAG: hypothetical protein AAF228_12095 [Pseudomonadota bacterium]